MEFDFDNLLHIGLAIGAVFQLVCILAIIVLPVPEEEQKREELETGSEYESTTVVKGPSRPPNAGTLTKRNKGKEKKLKK